MEGILKDNLRQLTIEAIRYFSRAFFYLYPFPLSLTVDESSNLVVLEKKKGFWKFLPWYFSIIFVTGLVGLGSCFYVILKFYLTHDIRILDAIIAIGASVFD